MIDKILKSNGYIDDIIRCINRHGDNAVKAIEKCGDNAVVLISEYGESAAKHISNYGDEAVEILYDSAEYGLKALDNGIDPKTIKNLTEKGISPRDYDRLCIFDADSAEEILHCKFSDENILKQLNLQSCREEITKNIKDLKNILKNKFADFANESGKTVSVCMDASNGNIGQGACNGIYEYNPTILDYQDARIFCDTPEEFVDYYQGLLTDDYIDNYFAEVPNDLIDIDSVKREMNKLREAIENTKNIAKNQGAMTNIEDAVVQSPSLETGWYVENCAEVWAARNAILEGASFDDLIFRTEYVGNGEVHGLCQNCLVTFIEHYIVD